MYQVGLGDSPSSIAGYLSGNAQRYPELLAANPHKPIVYAGGMPTFTALGVGEHLNVPSGFVGDALAEAFGVGTHEEAFDQLERTFGIGATPESAFDALEQAFGTGGDFDDLAPVKRTQVVFTDPQIEQQRKEREESRPLKRGERQAAWEKKYGKKKGIFETIGGGIADIVSAPVKAVTAIGKAAGKGVKEIGKLTAKVAKATGEALATGAKFVAQAGGDAVKFIGKQAKAFAKDPMGQLAKIATTGGLSLIGVDPEKALNAVGIPSPDQMLSKLGLPTPTQITNVAFRSVTNPKVLLDKIPGINELTKYIPDMPDPMQMAGNLVNAALSGDLKALKREALAIGHMVADVASMVPGVGNVIGGPLSAAITLLETGSALKMALALLLGQIPGIPPMIRDILRVAFNAIADIVEKSKSVTDVLLDNFRKGVKEQARKNGVTGPLADIVESALNGAMQLIFKNKPLDKAALDIAKDGLEVARKNVAKGIAPPKELLEAEKTLSDLEGVYKKINTEHALTQGIVKLAKQDLAGKNPVIQKQIKDLRASVEGQKLIGQAHAKKVFKEMAKLSPKEQAQLRELAAMKALPPEKQAQLRDLAALKKLPLKEQEELRKFAELKKLSPTEQAQLRAVAAIKKLPPEQQAQLKEFAAMKALSPKDQKALAAMNEAGAPPAPAPVAPTTVPTAPAFQYGPYPQAA